MFKGYSVALPLTYNKQDGPFLLNKTMQQVVKQNLKNLVLTDQGERVMIPDYGVGIRKFLFENLDQTTSFVIEEQIKRQVAKYLPYITIENVQILEDPNNLNKLNIFIAFTVPAINFNDVLIVGG